MENQIIRAKYIDRGLSNISYCDIFIDALAIENKKNPIRDYFESTDWDGKDYIKELANYFGSNLAEEAFKEFLSNCISKALDHQQNHMLVLQGPQGIGKSYFARWLAKPFRGMFIERAIDPDSDYDKQRLADTFLWEVMELGSTTRRKDIESLKGFITQQEVNFRLPYARREIITEAICNLVGTINDATFLRDHTGSRRFRVLSLKEIDRNYSKLNVDKIWSQAFHLYKNGGYQIEHEDAFKEANEEAEVEDANTDIILEKIEITKEDGERMTSKQILDLCYPFCKDSEKNTFYNCIKQVMMKLGCPRKKSEGIWTYRGVTRKG